MAEYDPPTQDLPIFDNLVFVNPDDFVTIGYANTHYLKFPSAQGTENLQAINVNGLATFNNDIHVSDGSYIEIKDSVDNILIMDNIPTTLTNTAGDNVIVATKSANMLTVGQGNIILGNNNFTNNTNGNFNFCIGQDQMINAPIIQTEYNVLIGKDTGRLVISSLNTMVGHFAGQQSNTGSNTYFGYSAGNLMQSDNNVSVGTFALRGSSNPANNTGDRNVAIGSSALFNISAGTHNVCMGTRALHDLTTSTFNVAIGDDIADKLQTGNRNTFLGYKAAKRATVSNNCVIIGDDTNDNAANITQDKMTCIGSLADNMGFVNSTAIGYNAKNTAINQVRLGTATETVSCPGTLTFKMTSDNTSGTYYVPFSKTTAGTEGALFVDDTTGPLTYNPGTSTLTALNFAGTASTASTVTTTSSNVSATCYIPFTDSTAGTNKSLLVDDTSGPLTYNPATATLTCAYTNLSQGVVNPDITLRNYFWTDRTTRPTGGNNVCIGYWAGNALNTSSENVLIGSEAGRQAGSGNRNVYLGYRTSNGSNSSNCVSIGYDANQGNTHGSNCVAVGSASSCSTFNTCVALGSGATCTANNQIRLGTSAQTVSCPGPTILDGVLSTSVTTSPTTTRMLGYTTSKTTGWSNITNTATNINTIAIDGTTVGFGVYRIEVFVNYTNGAAIQNFRIGVSTVSATLQAPLCVRSTQSSEDDGVLISQTISAYANTTFYIVAQSSAAAGATLYTSGARNSTINLTRIA